MGARSRWACESCGRQLGTLERMPRGVDGLRLVRAVEDCFFAAGTLTVLCPRCDAPSSYAQTWAQTAMSVG
jgi:hypothetical protein